MGLKKRKKYDKITDKNLKLITFGKDQLSKSMRGRLKSGHATIMDVTFRNIGSIYKILYSQKIEEGYSVIFEYRGMRKILLFN